MSTSKSNAHVAIPSLDGIRAVSVLIVLVAHAGYGSIVPGGLGVTIFFFLSGYLITTLMLDENERTGNINICNFYIRRTFRLLPPLLLTLAIAYILAWEGKIPGGTSIIGFTAQVLYFANYYQIFFDPGGTTPDSMGILWSLAVEEHFYIFYPAVMSLLLCAAYRPSKIAAVFTVVCITVLCWRLILVIFFESEPERTYYASDTRIDSILYGCLLALTFNPISWRSEFVRRDTSASLSAVEWCLLLAAGVVLLGTLLYRDPVFRETIRYSLQGLALMPIFYCAIRRSNHFIFRILNISWIAKIGVYSYAIYLIHFVAIDALKLHMPELIDSKLTFLACTFAVSLAYAFIVDEWIDPHFRVLRKRFRSTNHSVAVSATS